MTPSRSEHPPARVLIVDDHPAVREALAVRIAEVSDLEVCGEAANLADALDLIETKSPDLAVIDISLKGGDGLDLIKRIKARGLEVQMLVWSMHSEALYAERVLRAGARGYISKDQATSQIVEAMRDVLAGKVHLSPTMTQKLLGRASGRRPGLDGSPVDSLSDRELAVLRLIGQGNKTTAIAHQLSLSVKTVETYRDRIRQKLGIADGHELLRFATQWSTETETS
jgi:DNA-binding NarL/FixJ family response regulator